MNEENFEKITDHMRTYLSLETILDNMRAERNECDADHARFYAVSITRMEDVVGYFYRWVLTTDEKLSLIYMNTQA